MAQELYLNILEPQYSRYISLRPELEAYLKEMYPEQSDFQVKVGSLPTPTVLTLTDLV
jgi:hypothetical protein